MHSTGEYFSMYSCALKVGLFRLKDTAFAISRFGLSIKFWKPLLLHYVKYFYYSPFAVSKHFLEQKKEKDVYSYGQTPIKVMVELCDALDIQSSHRFLDLGCGSGKFVFMVGCVKGCNAVGVDFVPEFILKGYDICKSLKSCNIQFVYGNVCLFPLEGYDIIYLSGTCMPDELIKDLAKGLARLSSEVKIVTTSFALSDYLEEAFSIDRVLNVEFEWGYTQLFIQSPK